MVDHLYPAIVLPAVQMARQLGLQVVSDIELEMPQLAEIRAGIDHFICSAEFAVPYTGCQDPPTACEMLSRSAPHRAVVVTAGREGCYWCTHDQPEVKHVPGHRIEPVDTTGCGDVFHGAYCHGLAAGWSIERMHPFRERGRGGQSNPHRRLGGRSHERGDPRCLRAIQTAQPLTYGLMELPSRRTTDNDYDTARKSADSLSRQRPDRARSTTGLNLASPSDS